LWKLICTNGMGSWDSKTAYRFAHRGNRESIANGVSGAIEALRTEASGVLEAYDTALGVMVDDIDDWMMGALGGLGATKPQIQRSVRALMDPTTTRASSLAAVVDGITLAAQDEGDRFRQEEMEGWASRILRSGISLASRNSGRIPAVA